MQSGNKAPSLKIVQQITVFFILILTITFLFFFRNLFLQPTLILKSFGELSDNPEIALKNNKPTFLEFYAEWCEVCKEMAPKVSDLRNEYHGNFNFVFLNVDNPKWESFIRKFNVNGIPQVNLLDSNGDLKFTFIGKQDEENIKKALENLNGEIISNKQFFNSDFSEIKDRQNYQFSPRSHG